MASALQVEHKRELQTLAKQLSEATDAYDPPAGPEDSQSRTRRIEIVNKAKQLMLKLTEPVEASQQHGVNMMELVAIRTLLSVKVLPKIPEHGSVSLQDLSHATGVQKSLLERQLRLLVGTKFIDQVSDEQYQHTKVSHAYSIFPGPALFFEVVEAKVLALQFFRLIDTITGFLVLDRFHEYLRARNALAEPEDQRYSPYSWTHGQDGTPIYEIMAQNPERLKVFQMGMSLLPALDGVVGFYDFGRLDTGEEEEERKILVDMGGDTGHAIATILGTYPQLAKKPDQFGLQDLRDVVQLAAKQSGLPDGVIKMGHDFFTAQPIKGAKAYYMRNITHNYSGPFCVQIFKRLADAMKPDSVVLISERILPKRFGEADLPAAMYDMIMLNMGGKERTEDGFKEILEAAGLTVVKIWRPGYGHAGLIEAKLAGGAGQ